MNNFPSQIRKIETEQGGTYIIKKGQTPIVFTSAHGIAQKKRNAFRVCKTGAPSLYYDIITKNVKY